MEKSRWFLGTWPILFVQNIPPWMALLDNLKDQTHADFIEGQLERDPVTALVSIKFRIHFPNSQRVSKFHGIACQVEVASKDRANPEILFQAALRLDGPCHSGIPPGVGRHSKYLMTSDYDYDSIVTAAKESRFEDIPSKVLIDKYHNLRAIAKDNMVLPPDHHTTKGIWVVGAAGVGKSTWARQYCRLKNMQYFVKDSQTKWWDGYKREEAVIIDDFDESSVRILANYLKKWADMFSTSVEIKGGALPLAAKTIIITSNYEITKLFPPKVDESLTESIQRRFKRIFFPRFHRTELTSVDPANPLYYLRKSIEKRKKVRVVKHNWNDPNKASKIMSKLCNNIGVDDPRLRDPKGFPLLGKLSTFELWAKRTEQQRLLQKRPRWVDEDWRRWGYNPDDETDPRHPTNMIGKYQQQQPQLEFQFDSLTNATPSPPDITPPSPTNPGQVILCQSTPFLSLDPVQTSVARSDTNEKKKKKQDLNRDYLPGGWNNPIVINTQINFFGCDAGALSSPYPWGLVSTIARDQAQSVKNLVTRSWIPSLSITDCGNSNQSVPVGHPLDDLEIVFDDQSHN